MNTRSSQERASKGKSKEPVSKGGSSESHPNYFETLSRPQAATYLGISLSEFKRREGAGIYVFTHTTDTGRRRYSLAYLDKKKGEGISRVPRSELIPREVAVPSVKTKVDDYDPDTAALVFGEFRIDEDLTRIVEKLKLHPNLVEAIHIDWVTLRARSGGFYVRGETVREIDALELDGFPVTSGEELAAALGAIASTQKPCEACHHRPRRATTLCSACERVVMDGAHHPPSVKDSFRR